jgi:hypothetical protein
MPNIKVVGDGPFRLPGEQRRHEAAAKKAQAMMETLARLAVPEKEDDEVSE